jgi:spermidine synthase
VRNRKTNGRLRSIRGDYWDLIALKHLLKERPVILYRGTSRYQNILLLEARDVRLYLDRQLQFSSLDERIYHEALVHPAMSMTPRRSHVLILGGGDGFAVREALKYKDVKSVDLVELDPRMIQIARSRPVSVLNGRALFDKRVKIHLMDARKFLPASRPPGSKRYNVVILDFPDPSDRALSKLYSKEFLGRIAQSLAPGGKLVVQSNSTEDKPSVYWSIYHTLRSLGMQTKSYSVYVPSFGDWGFQLASYSAFNPGRCKPLVPNRTLPRSFSALFRLPKELLRKKGGAKPNTLTKLRLFKYWRKENRR